MLKRFIDRRFENDGCQPPSGGCVLKPAMPIGQFFGSNQPPSGGCVLKPRPAQICMVSVKPAAFGRLCVETYQIGTKRLITRPAAFGRLCVETAMQHILTACYVPAAFGRLCVETFSVLPNSQAFAQPPSGGCVLKPFVMPSSQRLASRLRAAVC